MLLKQAFLCAICGEEPYMNLLRVDHDHVTGKIRGLLCTNCNSMLGFIEDDISILQAAIEYLERSQLST